MLNDGWLGWWAYDLTLCKLWVSHLIGVEANNDATHIQFSWLRSEQFFWISPYTFLFLFLKFQ